MKKISILAVLAISVFIFAPTAEAYSNDYNYSNQSQYLYSNQFGSSDDYRAYLVSLIRELLQQLESNSNYGYQGGSYGYQRETTVIGNARSGSSNDGDEPEVTTEDARSITSTSAYLEGEVDMNDFRNGKVFFVYGEDEDQIEDVEDDYDSYSDVDEDGDDLQKILVDSDLDEDDDYSKKVSNLDRNTDYYFQICVEYEDEDDDDTLECGGVEEFDTDSGSSSNDDEPDVETLSATNITDDSAKMRGEVDMNDFEDGLVFFVYGEDEDQIEDVEDDYDSYSDVDEDGDDLQKRKVDSSLDGDATYTLNVSGFDDETDYYFQICVEYEDDDNDEVLVCGGVEDFETDD